MYKFTHGGTTVQVERFTDKRSGALTLRGKVLYDNDRPVYRKRRAVDGETSSYQFACELLTDIAKSDSYVYNDRRWAVVILRHLTIDNRRRFHSDDSYRKYHEEITDLSYLVDSTWRFENHPLTNSQS